MTEISVEHPKSFNTIYNYRTLNFHYSNSQFNDCRGKTETYTCGSIILRNYVTKPDNNSLGWFAEIDNAEFSAFTLGSVPNSDTVEQALDALFNMLFAPLSS